MPFFGGGGASASNMVGATSSAAGTAGLVPQPAAGDNDKFLNGDATFQVPPKLVSPALPDWLTGTNSQSAEGCLYGVGQYGYTIGANRLGICPVFIRQGKTYTKLGARIANDGTRTSTKLRVGIYNASNTNSRPTTLIVESGELTYTSNTAPEGTISQYIKAGFYWLAVVTDGTHNFNGVQGFGSASALTAFVTGIRIGNTSIYTPSVSQPFITQTYGALPADVTSSTISFNNDVSFPHLFIY